MSVEQQQHVPGGDGDLQLLQGAPLPGDARARRNHALDDLLDQCPPGLHAKLVARHAWEDSSKPSAPDAGTSVGPPSRSPRFAWCCCSRPEQWAWTWASP